MFILQVYDNATTKNCVGWHKTTPVQVFELKKQFPPSKSTHLVDNFRKHKGPFL